jgi:hypothetical protein
MSLASKKKPLKIKATQEENSSENSPSTSENKIETKSKE